ncbi:MAG: sialate O-acetylesterase [Candidatus Methylacidiphilales bacterium]
MIKKLKPLLILLTGESNSGGLAYNSEASAIEKTVNTKLKYLNNTTLIFEDYDIQKSMIGHVGYIQPIGTFHGWDLEISNLTKTNYFKNREVYIVKTGQGGSRIIQWVAGSSYETTFNTRVNAAKALINKPHDTIILYSQGINDIVNGYPSATWKIDTKNRINTIRTLIQSSPIVMTLFESPMPYTAYNYAMYEIANELKGIYITSTKDLSTNSGDVAHWSYASMKILAKKMLDTFFKY